MEKLGIKWINTKEGRRAYQSIYRQLNKTKIIHYRRDQRINLVHFLGAYCHDCGFNEDIRALQIDHIFSKGTQEAEKKFTNNFTMYRFYLKNPDLARRKLQILCANCNTIKRYTHGEYCYG